MNLIENLSRKYNKNSDEIIFFEIIENPDNIDLLMDVLQSQDWRLSHRAAGPLTKIARKRPNMLDSHQTRLLNLALNPLHDAHLRNAFRIFQYLSIQEQTAGPLYDLCSRQVQSIHQPTAIRAFGATIMKNIAFQFPELIEELILVFYEYKDYGTVGFKNRISRLIQEINKRRS